jgi:hypothetical protein
MKGHLKTISWQEIHLDIRLLVELIPPGREWLLSAVVGFGSGGSVGS